MYTALIEDQPEKRSRGKSVFTFPLVLLFILVGVASTRHLLNVNANNDLESMLAETTPTKQTTSGDGAVQPAASDDTTSKCSATNCWCCIDECHKEENCKVIMALDMGSSGTKTSLWAIQQKKADTIPYIEKVFTANKKGDLEKYKPHTICGIWSDKTQFQLDKKSFCDEGKQKNDNKDPDPQSCNGMNLEQWKAHFKKEMGCFLKKELKGKKEGKKIPVYIDGIYGGFTAGLRNDPDITKKLGALETRKVLSLEIAVTGVTRDKKEQVCDSIASALGGVSTYCSLLGARVPDSVPGDRRRRLEDSTLYMEASVADGNAEKLAEQAISSGFVSSLTGLPEDTAVSSVTSSTSNENKGFIKETLTALLNEKPDGQKPKVHIRMLSGEEEGYYEWLGFNWEALRGFTKDKDSTESKNAQKELKNTFTIGGASAQIAIPTTQPMNTLDNTYYFHIGDNTYWIYTNSLIWGGGMRLANMMEEYAKSFNKNFPFRIKKKKAINLNAVENEKPIVDMFFDDNQSLLCGDICTKHECNNKRLYQGLCVMGFHFPDLTQWLTYQFVGNKDYSKLTDGNGRCLEKVGENAIDLGFLDKCDDPELYKTNTELDTKWWSQHKPTVTLPFYGRFWHLLRVDANHDSHQRQLGMPVKNKLELSHGDDINWSAIWAAVWLHGQFQGFPLAYDKKRRHLAGLKGEYTLGPLTIPAHFGTPEDEQ